MDLKGVFKRRRFVVKGGLQLSAVFYLFFVTLAIVAFHTWLTYFRVSKVAQVAGDTPLAFMFAQDVVITIAFMAIFALFAGIFGSHKVAGPLYRFEQVLKKVQKGDISEQIQLRRGDMLIDFAGELNLALANLRELAAEDRLLLQEAARLIADVRGRTSVAEIQAKLDRAVELLGKVGSKLVLEPEWRRQAGRSAERALDVRAALAASGPSLPAASAAALAAAQGSPIPAPAAAGGLHGGPFARAPAPVPVPPPAERPAAPAPLAPAAAKPPVVAAPAPLAGEPADREPAAPRRTLVMPPPAGGRGAPGGPPPPPPAPRGSGSGRPSWIADRTLPGAAPAPGAGLPDERPAIAPYLQVAKTVPEPVPPPKV